MTKRFTVLLLAAVLLTTGLSGCKMGKVQNPDSDKIDIVCTIFPVYDWLNEIIGTNADKFNITLLAQNGDLHNYQPTAQDIVKLHTCDLFVYVGGASDQWTEKALTDSTARQIKLFDLLDPEERLMAEPEHTHNHEGHSDEEYDEHIWLSLRLARKMVNAVCGAVSALDTADTKLYERNAGAYCQRLGELDGKYKKAVEESADKTIVFADRFPFLYMTNDYGLECYAAFSGCSADTNASFETVASLAESVKDLDKETVLVLENSDREIADAVISATGKLDVKIAVMNSCQSIVLQSNAEAEHKKLKGEDLADGADYIEIMTENLVSLKEALK